MSDQTKGENDIKQNYITVIPVDYPRSRIYQQSSDYLVDQYNDYLRDRSRDEYLRGDYNINNEPQFDDVGPLYTVSQRFEREKPHLTTSNSSSYGLMNQDVDREWERPLHGAAATAHVNQVDAVQIKGKDATSSGVNNKSSLDKDENHKENSLQNSSSICICVYLMSRTVVQMDVCNGSRITTQELIQALILEEELGLPRTASNVFSLWMCSPLLEVQLKPQHRPLDVRRRWIPLLNRYTIFSEERKHRDEPVLSFQRNIFFSKKDEEKIKDQKLLELLYEEARNNILEGRYPCEASHYIMLAGIQARIELGPYNAHVHTLSFFREQQRKFLPRHACSSKWSWLRISGKNSPEVRLLEQYKRIPATTPARKLVRKYLEFCWSLPFYGAAFFPGQIEQPVRGLTSLMTHQDMPVLVSINGQGVYVIDDIQSTLLLGLKYEELSWDFAKPSQEDNPDCLPCIFLQFMVLENGTRVSKILQVFSKQAVMMDALINAFVDEIKQKSTSFVEETDRPLYDTSTDSDVGGERIPDTQVPLTTVGRRELAQSCLSNKLSKLTLATFDEDGRCIGQMGSWAFSY